MMQRAPVKRLVATAIQQARRRLLVAIGVLCLMAHAPQQLRRGIAIAAGG
jgi:hypothetical protein